MPFTPDEVAEIRMIVQSAQPTLVALDAVVVSGTWNPADSTIQVALCDTLALPIEPGNGPVLISGVQLATPMVGRQEGPVGGERVIIVKRQSGWIAHIESGADDVPSAPAAAGESVYEHRATGAILAFRNDAATAGDGLGAMKLTGLAQHSMTTAGGISRVASDTAQKIVDTAGNVIATIDKLNTKHTLQVGTELESVADGVAQKLTHTIGSLTAIYDGAGNVISLVPGGAGGQLNLGALGSALSAANNAAHIGHLTAYDSSLQTARLNDVIKMANLLHTAGTVTAPQLVTILAALVAGWGNTATIPGGSSIVKIAN